MSLIVRGTIGPEAQGQAHAIKTQLRGCDGVLKVGGDILHILVVVALQKRAAVEELMGTLGLKNITVDTPRRE